MSISNPRRVALFTSLRAFTLFVDLDDHEDWQIVKFRCESFPAVPLSFLCLKEACWCLPKAEFHLEICSVKVPVMICSFNCRIISIEIDLRANIKGRSLRYRR